MKNYLLVLFLLVFSIQISAQSFTKSQVYDSLALTNKLNKVTLFDYDGDGDDDVFCYGGNGDNRILVFENNNGEFDSSFVFYEGSFSIRSITSIDFDLDGDFDLVVSDGGFFLKFENLGNGNFNQSNLGTYSPSPSRQIRSADIDNDGIEDLVSSSNSNLIWIKGLGGGNFETTPNTLTTVGGSVVSFELTDLNNDGDIDIITQYEETTNTSSSAMSINNGNGSFTTTNSFPVSTGKFTGGYTLGDFNNDGWIDLAYVDRTFTVEKVIIRWNDQNNNFNSTATVVKDYSSISGRRALTVQAFDFDGDNNLDLLIGETRGSSRGEGIVFINDGNQNFSEHSEKIMGMLWGAMYTGNQAVHYRVEMFFSDFDVDGNIDILTNSYQDGDVIAHFQDNNSSFSTSTYLNHFFEGIQNFQVLDYDADGNNDLVTVDEKDMGKLEVAYGNGSNQFDSSEVIIDNRTAHGAVGSQLVLWNNNSDYDLLYSSSNKVFIHLDFNTPNDTVIELFTSNPNPGANTGFIGYTNTPYKVFEVADIDNDGDNDLLIPQQPMGSSPKTYYWVENNGGTSFTVHPISSLGFTSYLLLDVDNDGDLDFVGATQSSPNELVFFEMNSATKTYTNYQSIGPVNQINYQFAAGDIDGDGDEDIVISGLSWLENDGAGNFTAPASLVSGYDTRSHIVIDDINNDGLLDIITNVSRSNPSRQLVVPLFNQGGNIFEPLTQELEVFISSAIATGDFNGNGFKSIVAGSFEDQGWTPIIFDFCINSFDTLNVDICSGDSYTLADGTELTNITQNDTYVSTLSGQAANGCDSIVTENINVLIVSTGVDTITACDSYTWINGITYTASNNTATDTLVNSVGCDSIITLNLTINQSTTFSDTVTACDTYLWQGTNYTSSGTYTDTIANSLGCDSILTLHLTIKQSTASSETITACDSYFWQGTTYTNSGTYTDTIANSVGCDSILTLNLTINQPTTSSENITSCESYLWQGTNYTSSGTYTDTIANSLGCDSVLTLNLTINNATSSTDVVSACGPYTWIDGNTYSSSNNSATTTLTNSAGCDSVVTLDLNISSTINITDVVSACDSYTWLDGVTYTSSNNTASVTYTSSAGCDSIITLDLTINNATSSIDVVSACNSYTWIDGNTYSSSNNSATFMLTNAAGCDSVVTLDLTINNTVNTTEEVNACGSYTWVDGVTYTNSNNTATFTYTSSAGCDSIVTLDLTINNATSSTDVVSSCGPYTWIDGNTYSSSNNSATYTLINSAGCDSVVTLDLSIGNLTTATDVVTSCGSYTWIDGNTYTSNNNSATFTVPGSGGCDTLLTLDLTVNPVPDNSISLNELTLTADIANADYQWIDCESNSPLSGETSQSFTASENGLYGVEITLDNCSVLSDCININTVGLKRITSDGINVYPNPTNDLVYIEVPEQYIGTTILLYSKIGGLLESKIIQHTKLVMDLSKYTQGVYLLKSKDTGWIIKIVKI